MTVFDSYSKERKQQYRLYVEITKLRRKKKRKKENGVTYFASDNIIDLFASYFNYQNSKYVSCRSYQNLY